jgi:uncharacterized phage protein (TIGR02218 family)
MRTLPPGMQAHLSSGATSLCWCWRLERLDGQVFGFTDHDRTLSFDDTTFEPESGFSASELSTAVGLGVDHAEATGALRSAHLSEADLAAGHFDNAKIELWRVNWADVAQRVVVMSGTLGEVSLRDGAFSAELRSLAHALDQERGRAYQYQCDADLGDARCGVDLELGAFKGVGAVLSVQRDHQFAASGLGDFDAGWFARGRLIWTSGENAGTRVEVKAHARAGSDVSLSLWHRPSRPLAPGDEFVVQAGCDKQFSTCQLRFANSLNFRGFPHLPGNDFIIEYPDRGDPKLSGKSMFNG